MALRGNLIGLMRSVMKINLNPFASQFSTGIVSTASKSAPLSSPSETCKQFSAASMNRPQEASKFSAQFSSAPMSNLLESPKLFSPAPLRNKLEATKKFTDVPQTKNPDPNIPHQAKSDNDSGSDDYVSENTG